MKSAWTMSWRRYNTAKALIATGIAMLVCLETWHLVTSFSWYRALGDVAMVCFFVGVFLVGPYKTKAKP